nr:CotH kinase family protein [Paludibacter sp.]
MKKHLSLKFSTILLFFIINSNLIFSQTINHWETAIFNSDTWKYLVPVAEPASTWRSLTFDDTSWLSGSGGFGYNNNDDGTVIWTQGTKPTSVFMRIKFNVADTSKISSGVFHIDYDDAFVAYLNGIEIARVGLTGTYPTYNQLGTNHDAVMFNGGLPDAFILSKKTLVSCLNKGANVLTIQVHNSSVNSSDMSSNAFLSFAIKDATKFFRTTPAWFVSPIPTSSLLTYLPIISISTNGQTINNEPKILADMKIIHHGGSILNDINDEPNVYNGKIGIEIRGASSSGYPQTPYGLETRDVIGNNLDTALLGMPSENDWVLLSNWNEKSFARNLLSFDIFTKMGHYTPRMRLCEVLINNDYKGIYLFGEKIKIGKGRVSIAKLTTKDLKNDSVTGGYIFKTDYDDGVGTFWTSNYSPINRPGAKPRFVYHDPKAEELAVEQKTYIAGYVNALESALYNSNFKDPVSGYRAYLDVNTFIDYFILEEVARNVDGYKKSRFFHKNKDSKNKLIDAGPVWDFDWAWKNLDDCILYKNTTGEGWAWNINYCN